MIRWGKVKEITDNQAKVTLNSLEEVDNKYKLVKLSEKHPFSIDIVPNITQDAIVAVHWNQVIIVLTEDQVSRLQYWTESVIEAINK